MYSNIKNM